MTDAWDVLDEEIGPATTWTRVNVGEAVPGVPTPLTWTWMGPASDVGVSRAWVNMGVFPARDAARKPAVEDRFVAISGGRALLNLDRLRAIGDRIPFNSGDKLEQTLFSSDEVTGGSRPVRRRYPFVLAKLPIAVITARRSLLASVPRTEAWWRESVRLASGDVAVARTLIVESARRYSELTTSQSATTIAGQGLFDLLARVCGRYGLADSAGALATSNHETAEIQTVEDLWQLARGELTLETFLDRHGYHAAIQGELAVPSWRVDDEPVVRLAETYARRGAAESPAAAQEQRRAERDVAERELMGRVPAPARPAVRMLLATVRSVVPLRETARMQFLQCYDVGRAAAERLGRDLCERGLLVSADDVFYLTVDELAADDPPGLDVVALRRERRAYYEARDIPVRFTGTPEPQLIAIAADTSRLEGIGGSPGVVEGIARVIAGPDDPNDIEDGEILVAETTNPSYASFFLVAAAVVVDIGGMLSHGAIVAREMGIPCVINTKNARQVIRTGDRIRVDGDEGTVEILERALVDVEMAG